MNETPEVQVTVPSKEELIRKIMFLLSAPAKRLASALNAHNRTKCVGDCGREAPLPKGGKLSPNFCYTCEECSALVQAVQAIVDALVSGIHCQKSKETSKQWRKTHKEEANEYKRRKRAGDSYVESRKELMSEAAWEAKVEEAGNICSICGKPLTRKSAIRSADGPTYVPMCRSCLCRKAANERWTMHVRMA
jgi:hypothetical protein